MPARRRRPEDGRSGAPGWNWGMATHRIEDVGKAATHLPDARSMTPAERHRLAAWLASDRGDKEAERRELERLSRSSQPIWRLSTAWPISRRRIGRRPGPPSFAARGVTRPASCSVRETPRAEAAPRDAIEMAGLAEKLGRRFEARAFLILAISEDPERLGPARQPSSARRGHDDRGPWMATTLCRSASAGPKPAASRAFHHCGHGSGLS